MLASGSALFAAPELKGKTDAEIPAPGGAPTGAPTKLPVDPADAEHAIRLAKILAPAAYLAVTVRPSGFALVFTEDTLNAQASDLKISAMLLAKAISDASKGKIVRVQCVFYFNSSHKKGQSVLVAHGDLIAYGAGKESQKELLNSLLIAKYPLPVTADQLESATPEVPDKTFIFALGKARQALITLSNLHVATDDPCIMPILKDVEQLSPLLKDNQIGKTYPIIEDLNAQVNDLNAELKKIAKNNSANNLAKVQDDDSPLPSDLLGVKSGTAAGGTAAGVTSDNPPPAPPTVSSMPPRLGKQIESAASAERLITNKLKAILDPDTPRRGAQFLLRVQVIYLIQSLEAKHKDVSKERAEYKAIENNLSDEAKDFKALRDKLRALHTELTQAAP